VVRFSINFDLLCNRGIRLLYDALALSASLALAVLTHFLALLFRQYRGAFTLDLYLFHITQAAQTLSRYFAPFVLCSLLIFFLFRFYHTYTFRSFRERLGSITAGLLLSNSLLVLFMYFANEPDYFPRGITIFTFCFSLLFVGAPRLLRPLLKLLNTRLERPEGRDHYVQSVLVIGGAGFIGSVLTEHLLERGLRVRVLDLMLFGETPLDGVRGDKRLELCKGDFRNIVDVAPALDGIDAVVHLGGLVGDPACAVNEELTIDINLAATRMLMELCRAKGIKRFVFASTCSVYGVSKQVSQETSALNPVSLYAKTKIDSENILLRARSDKFMPTILRLATVFGPSRRLRFDLVVNTFVAKALTAGSLEVYGGNQWRPFVHVHDVARAIHRVLTSKITSVAGEIFNVGSNSQNFRIADIGEKVAALIPGTTVHNRGDVVDPRDYRVSFDKITKQLGFRCEKSVDDGIRELTAEIRSRPAIDVASEQFNNYQHARLMVAQNWAPATRKLFRADLLDENEVTSVPLKPQKERSAA